MDSTSSIWKYWKILEESCRKIDLEVQVSIRPFENRIILYWESCAWYPFRLNFTFSRIVQDSVEPCHWIVTISLAEFWSRILDSIDRSRITIFASFDIRRNPGNSSGLLGNQSREDHAFNSVVNSRLEFTALRKQESTW